MLRGDQLKENDAYRKEVGPAIDIAGIARVIFSRDRILNVANDVERRDFRKRIDGGRLDTAVSLR